MTRPVIEPRSHGSLANIQLMWPNFALISMYYETGHYTTKRRWYILLAICSSQCDVTPSAPVTSTSSNHSTACDQLVVPIGVTHISLPLHQIQSMEQELKKRTNEQTLWVNSSAERELCNTAFPVYICKLTLTWISSETSTKQLECRLILTRSSFTGLDPLSCRLASLLRCPVSTASVRPPSPTANFLVPLSHSLTGVPTPLPVTSKSRVQNPLSGFAPKQRNRLLGGPPT